MKWIDKDNLLDFEEDKICDVVRMRIAVKMMKARIEELEEEIEDVRMDANETIERMDV